MDRLRAFLARMYGVLHRTPAEVELNEELDSHRAMLIEENIRRGLSIHEATRQANVVLGNPTGIKESVREQAGLPVLESLWQDVHYGLRRLRCAPGFTVTAILTLVLGIGANTAIFQLVDVVRLRMIPVPSPQELVVLNLADYTGIRGSQESSYPSLTNLQWEYVRDHQQGFAGVFAWSRGEFDLAGGGEYRPARASAEASSRCLASARSWAGCLFPKTTAGTAVSKARSSATDSGTAGSAPIQVSSARSSR